MTLRLSTDWCYACSFASQVAEAGASGQAADIDKLTAAVLQQLSAQQLK